MNLTRPSGLLESAGSETAGRRPGRERPKLRKVWTLMALPIFWFLVPGCGSGGNFPAKPLAVSGERTDYDTDGDGLAEFFCLADKDGRIDRIAYDDNGDGKPDRLVHLDAIDPRLCRHLVIVLDGIPFEVVKEFYDSGHLRVFHPPAVLIPPYPVMTDLALEDAFGYMPCTGFEARYYDRRAGSLVGGTGDYLAGKNEPFVKIIDYRAPTLDDGLAYLRPKAYFAKELAAARRIWDKREKQEVIAYFVSTACLGSRLGKEGQLHALRAAERLTHELLYQSGGLVKFTLFADHGQTNVPCKPAKLEQYLQGKGYRLVNRLRRDEDVAMVKFGLVTAVAMNTRKPAKLAEDLLGCEAVALASYAQGDEVVVCGRDGKAAIRSTDGKMFEYKPIKGDPLKLAALAAGKVNGRSLLKLTADGKHEYPDALYRLWRAHFALAENVPDVIVSLDDRFYNGSGFFAGMVSMVSTHGGLNWRNSATFIMSTAGKIDGPLRSEDIPGEMKRLFGREFPARR